MRADRLLSIMLLLQTRRRMTAAKLATQLEVSERTIHRDMEALSMAGIPVVADRGRGGGWSLLEGYETNLTGLNESEIQTLFLEQPNKLLDDLGLKQAAQAALIKLLASLPAFYRHDAEFVRNHIHIDSAGWHDHAESVASLPALQDAVWQEVNVKISYERSDGATIEREISPLGLVAKGRVWYLVASIDGDLRTYRVSRITNVQPLNHPIMRPRNFDLATYWEQSTVDFKANLPSYELVVRVHPDKMRWLEHITRYGRVQAILGADSEGWNIVQMRFDVEEEACMAVVGLGGDAEVLEPENLREKVVAHAQSLLMLYVR